MIWSSSCGRVEFEMTRAQAHHAFHVGDCEGTVREIMEDEKIKKQLAELTDEQLKSVLRPLGAWDEEELSSREENLLRFVWIVAGDIVDGEYEDEDEGDN